MRANQQSVWSICVGRISQLPRAAITLDKPILHEPPAGAELYPGASQVPAGTVTNRMFLQEFSSLSELVNDNNFMFFAPKERFTSRRLLDCYDKYEQWYKSLPQVLTLENVREPQPHIIVLQYVLSLLSRPAHRLTFVVCSTIPSLYTFFAPCSRWTSSTPIFAPGKHA
jgi:hypothetical protein